MTLQANCARPDWGNLNWSVDVPQGAMVTFSAQTADTRDKLDQAPSIPIAELPGDRSPNRMGERLQAAGIAAQEFLRIRATLTLGHEGASPILRQMIINWSCAN